MDMGAQVPVWLILGVFAAGIVGSTVADLHLRFCSYPQSLWVVASIFGALLASAVAPSPWMTAFVACVALSNLLSLWLFYRRVTVGLALPVMAAACLSNLAIWVAGLGILTSALRSTGIDALVAVMLGAAAYTTLVGFLQVVRGLKSIVYIDAAFGEIGTVSRVPTGHLHNVWKLSAINASLIPIGIGLALSGRWEALPCLLFVAAAAWQLWHVGSLTCVAGALAGGLVTLATSSHLITGIVACPLILVVYPFAKRNLVDDPRWEAWTIAWRLSRRNHFLGIGLSGWNGAQVQTKKEGERIWAFLHNDWLEMLFDCGPLPVLCALGYLGTAVARVWGGVSPLEAGLFGSLVSLAVISLGYMPWRTWPVNLFAFGILACWEATGGR
jgi:hypothetical protein